MNPCNLLKSHPFIYTWNIKCRLKIQWGNERENKIREIKNAIELLGSALASLTRLRLLVDGSSIILL